MLARLGSIIKDPEKRAILSWIGGGIIGIVTVAGAVWTAVTYIAGNKEAHEKSVTVVYIVDPRAATEVATQLIALRQTPAGLGERAAVSEAVQSIAHGANEGDSRLKQ